MFIENKDSPKVQEELLLGIPPFGAIRVKGCIRESVSASLNVGGKDSTFPILGFLSVGRQLLLLLSLRHW